MVKQFPSQNTYSTPGEYNILPIYFYFCKKSKCWSIFCSQDTFNFSPKDLFCIYLCIFIPYSILHPWVTIQFLTWFLLLRYTIVNQTRKGLG